MLKTGIALLAEPFLRDPNFKRSAVALVDHHEEGSVGFVLSRALEWRVSEVIDGFPEFDQFVSYGGPVQRDTLHFVHTLGDVLSDSIHVVDDLYWGGDFAQLTDMIGGGVATPQTVRFFLGYSGWGVDQLQEEYAEGTWVLAPLESSLVFATPPDRAWQRAMRRKGDALGVIGLMDDERPN